MNVCPECGLNLELGSHIIGCSQYREESYDNLPEPTENSKAIGYAIEHRTKKILKTYLTASTKATSEKYRLYMTDETVDQLVDDALENIMVMATINACYISTLQILKEQDLIDDVQFMKFFSQSDTEGL